MKCSLWRLLLACSLVVTGVGAQAQFVKGNDAVRVSEGPRTVETPPAPRPAGKVCLAAGTCHAGSWRMVETQAGLVECTEPYAREGSCRKSTYGVQKLRRVWVVKKGRVWLQCQYPDMASKCAEMFARPPANLPADAVQ
jgi:hypothetical protein